MDNAFLEANLGNIEKLDKELIALELLGSYEEEVPIRKIRGLINGMKIEIARLEGMVVFLVHLLVNYIGRCIDLLHMLFH